MFDQCVTRFWFWGKLCQVCTLLYNMAVCKTVKAKFILPAEWWQLWRFVALVFALKRQDFFCSSNFEVGSGGVSWPYNHSGASHRTLNMLDYSIIWTLHGITAFAHRVVNISDYWIRFGKILLFLCQTNTCSRWFLFFQLTAMILPCFTCWCGRGKIARNPWLFDFVSSKAKAWPSLSPMDWGWVTVHDPENCGRKNI